MKYIKFEPSSECVEINVFKLTHMMKTFSDRKLSINSTLITVCSGIFIKIRFKLAVVCLLAGGNNSWQMTAGFFPNFPKLF